jgi:hypothetical protein
VDHHKLSCERCYVGSHITCLPPSHRKIHLGVRPSKRRDESTLVKSVFSANYLKGRRICVNAPHASPNDVTDCTTILTHTFSARGIPTECGRSCKGECETSEKTNYIKIHYCLPLCGASLFILAEPYGN